MDEVKRGWGEKIMSVFVEMHSSLHMFACMIRKGEHETIRVCYNNFIFKYYTWNDI